ncbi:MAG TPA: sigma-70 family RNA polymerase sigma factor [Rhizomicrobium sp.]
MDEKRENGRENPDVQGAFPRKRDVANWFIREVLPLEAILMQFLHHNWRNQSDIADLRQDVYTRVCDAARRQLPEHAKRFVLTTARNLLINRMRDEHVVPIEAVADIDALGVAIDQPGPEQIIMARDDLRRLQRVLDRLSPRCREAMILAHIEGLSGQEIAARMNIGQATVSEHLANGIRALTDMMFGEMPDLGRKA